MAAGWIAKGPDQVASPEGSTPPTGAPASTPAGAPGWNAIGADEASLPALARPHQQPDSNAIENTRNIFQASRDVLFGHAPDPAAGGDKATNYGILPSLKDSLAEQSDQLTAGPSWSTLAQSYPHILKAQFQQAGAGYQEAHGAAEVASAGMTLAALNTLPQVAARLPFTDDATKIEAMAKDPAVKKAAISVGLDPVVLANQWGQYSGLTAEQQADVAAKAQQTLAAGRSNLTAGKSSRLQAWADQTAWAPSDLLNGKLDPWTLKGLAFNTALAVPAMAAVAAAAVGGTAVGGPAAGAGAAGATAAAIFAPAQRSQVKDQIDTQVNTLLQKADVASKVSGDANPVVVGLRQQAADLNASSDKIADTAAFLYAGADAAGALPVASVLSRAPGAQAVLNRIIGAGISKTAGGRIASAMIANGAGGIVQTALQKGIEAGIVHENQTLSDALKDIAYSGVTSAITALPISAAHEAAGAPARAAAQRSLDEDDLLRRAQSAANAPGAAPGGPGETYPGYRFNEETGKYEPTAGNTAATAAAPRLPSPATADSAGATNTPSPATNAPEAETIPSKAETYQAKVETLNQAAAQADKRSDLSMVPHEDGGWNIEVNGNPVAHFETAPNAREALAQARKLVGTAPADQSPTQATAQTGSQPGNDAASTQSQSPTPQDALEQTQPLDRRQDGGLRTRVDQMTPEQMKAALLTHELTGIPNRRAYEDSVKKPAQASVDVDSLKWINDNAGHEGGDQMLKAVAQALHEASGGNAYHISGDEFVVQGDTPEQTSATLANAQERLAGATLTFEHPDGRTVELKGIGVSHGIGKTLDEADTDLGRAKSAREQSGVRSARGLRPPGASIRAPEAGVQTEVGQPAASQAAAAPGQGSGATAGHAVESAEIAPEQIPQTPKTLEQHLENPDTRAELERMAGNAGWSEVGGKMIRRELNGGRGNEYEISRTPWIPKEPWFQDLAERLPAKGRGYEEALKAATSGGKISALERRVLTEMAEKASTATTDWRHPLTQEQLDSLPRDQQRARLAALEAEEARLEAEGERRAIEAESRGEAVAAGDDDDIPFAKGQGDLFGHKVQVQNELAKAREAIERKLGKGKEVPVETGRPDDIFSQSRRQVDIADLVKEGEASYGQVSEPRTGNNRATAGRLQSAPGVPTQLDIFSQRGSDQSKAAVAQLASRSKLSKIGEFRSAFDRIQTWRQAAHILAPIRKSPQEVMAALVVDATGKPLAVIRHSIGMVDSASVEPWSIAGSFAQVPGAASVYLAHNHPSENLAQSVPDNLITSRLQQLMRGSGIEVHGMLVVTPGGKAASWAVPGEHGSGEVASTAPGGKTKTKVPLLGRMLLAGKDQHPLLNRTLQSPESTLQIIKKVEDSGISSGALLLDSQHRIKGIVSMTDAQMRNLRTGDKALSQAALLKHAAEANTKNLVAFGSQEAVKNLQRFANAASIRPLDGIVKDSDGDWSSLAARGVGEAGDVFLRRGPTEPYGKNLSVADVQGTVEKILQGFRTKPADVVVVPTVKALQEHPDLAGRNIPEETHALMDPRSGKLFFVADQIHSKEYAASLLAHEYVVHFGLRAAFGSRRGSEYRAILEGVAKAAPSMLREEWQQQFPGQAYRPLSESQRLIAAEEVLARHSEDYLKDASSVPGKIRRFLDRLHGLLRDWFRKVFGLPAKFDDLFVKRTLADLEAFLRRGNRESVSGGQPTEPAFAGSKDTFFSGLARAVDAAKREKGTGAEWEATLRNMPGVKGEEIAWTGLKDWLEGRGRVTRAEVADYVAAHRVELGEVARGVKPDSGELAAQKAFQDYSLELAEKYNLNPNQNLAMHRGLVGMSHEEADEYTRLQHAWLESRDGIPTKYQSWATPGGENYRELLMTLKPKGGEELPPGYSVVQKDGSWRVRFPDGVTIGGWSTRADAVASQRRFSPGFQSQHWDERNVLAHVRFDDRTGPNGEKILHVHEVQSDWHQAGRRAGYLDSGELIEKPGWTNTEQNAGKVPDAPFKTTWPELAIKRMLRMAAEGGYDALSWDTGDTNAERYNMQQVADRITVTKEGNGKYGITARKGDHTVVEKGGLTEQQLADTIGKDMAQKAISSDEQQPVFRGDELKVGGAGMRGFYDDILPKKVNALVKKWGSSVEPDQVSGDTSSRYAAAAVDGGSRVVDLNANVGEGQFVSGVMSHEEAKAFADAKNGQGLLNAHVVKITPALRDSVLEGQPMFKRKPAGPPKPPRPPGAIRKGYDLAARGVAAIPGNELSLSLRRIADPVNISSSSKATALVARESFGELAQASEEALKSLEHFAKQFDLLPHSDRMEFIYAMEEGKPQPNQAHQPAADALRKLLDDWREKIRDLGVGALDNFIENYFPHIWKDADGVKKWFGQVFGRRPLKGPASFLKERTIPTTREGIEKGFVPVSTNPLVLVFAKVREMQRFYAGVKLMQRFKDEGLARFIPAQRSIPEGFTEINDAVGRVRQWSEAEQGFIERGKYVMPTDAARVINNHLGGSALRNFLPAQLFKSLTNVVTPLQLSFSGFHLGFTTLDAIVSKNAVGIERLLHGEPIRAAKAFLEANSVLGGVALNLHRGNALLKAYSNITGATPQMRQIVQGLMAAGGRVKMDNYYAAGQGKSPFRQIGFLNLAHEVKAALTQPENKLIDAAKAMGGFPREYATRLMGDLREIWETHPGMSKLAVPLEIAGRAVRASTAIIMEHLVPLQKLGVFSDLAADHIRRNPGEDPVAFAHAMQSVWNSVDNRLGELVYDNLFWNRTFKDVNHMAVRAVGWNLGTIREIGGAPVDVIKTLDYLARGAPAEDIAPDLQGGAARIAYEQAKHTMDRIADKVGHKIAYTIALVGTVAVAGAITNALFGQKIEELKDYFFPKTGALTKYGTPERISLPSYMKDIYEYADQPFNTLINKANPMFGIIHALSANEDFYGDPTRGDPDAPWYEQLKEGAKYSIKATVPFSIQGTQHFAAADEHPGLKVAPFFGVTPAPARITSPDQMERYQHSQDQKAYAKKLQRDMRKAVAAGDQVKAAELRSELLQERAKVKQTDHAIREDKIRARDATKKISSLIQGKSKSDAVAALTAAGLPAFASLWGAMPDQPRPRVAQSLEAFA